MKNTFKKYINELKSHLSIYKKTKSHKMIHNVGDKVRCIMLKKDGVVIRNKEILGLKKTHAIQVQFDDGSNKIYLANKCECLIPLD